MQARDRRHGFLPGELKAGGIPGEIIRKETEIGYLLPDMD